MSRLVFKTLLFTADFAAIAAASLALYCYAFDVRDSYGYAIDGVATTVTVLSVLFALGCNRINHRELDAIHPKDEARS